MRSVTEGGPSSLRPDSPTAPAHPVKRGGFSISSGLGWTPNATECPPTRLSSCFPFLTVSAVFNTMRSPHHSRKCRISAEDVCSIPSPAYGKGSARVVFCLLILFSFSVAGQLLRKVSGSWGGRSLRCFPRRRQAARGAWQAASRRPQNPTSPSALHVRVHEGKESEAAA